ncbi:hypothetical protein [Faecalibaculum rodentium]|jgi:hypothetical protein|uniref:hypothetical protein n=2 Tax=Faecalibaculum rodentium TaxID=1702221 RepID=UPI001179B381|nr:hypothetical protein [Faecalibaculum rodentium]
MKILSFIKKVALVCALATTTIPSILPISANESHSEIMPQNIETWTGEGVGYIQGYRVRVGAVMTFNGQWNSRAWIIYSSHPSATVCQTFANPDTSSVAVFIDFNNDGRYEGSITVFVSAI